MFSDLRQLLQTCVSKNFTKIFESSAWTFLLGLSLLRQIKNHCVNLSKSSAPGVCINSKEIYKDANPPSRDFFSFPVTTRLRDSLCHCKDFLAWFSFSAVSRYFRSHVLFFWSSEIPVPKCRTRRGQKGSYRAWTLDIWSCPFRMSLRQLWFRRKYDISSADSSHSGVMQSWGFRHSVSGTRFFQTQSLVDASLQTQRISGILRTWPSLNLWNRLDEHNDCEQCVIHSFYCVWDLVRIFWAQPRVGRRYFRARTVRVKFEMPFVRRILPHTSLQMSLDARTFFV